jgi:hypothetical protein
MEKFKFLTLPGLEIGPLDLPDRSHSLYRLHYRGFTFLHYRFHIIGGLEVNLRPTLSRPVCPDVRLPSGACDQFFYLLEIFFRQLRLCYFVATSLTRGRVCNLLVQLLLCLARAVTLESKSLTAIFYRLIWDCVPPSSPLTTRRNCRGGILTRLHLLTQLVPLTAHRKRWSVKGRGGSSIRPSSNHDSAYNHNIRRVADKMCVPSACLLHSNVPHLGKLAPRRKCAMATEFLARHLFQLHFQIIFL